MAVEIEPIGPDRLPQYGRVPMVCDVRSVLAVEELEGGLGGLRLRELPLETPYTKNYDVDCGGGPLRWSREFDLARWQFWIARDAGEAVGAAAVAWNTPAVELLGGRNDLAVLWDIRVCPSRHRRGIGTLLFRRAVRWATEKRCSLLKIETQNVNVPACRFYARMGCVLGEIDRFAYRQHAHVAHEVRLTWYLDLLQSGNGGQ